MTDAPRGCTREAPAVVLPPAGTPVKTRFQGVDIARGVALIGMLAANVFNPLTDDGRPSLAVETVTGRSATMFAMVAGISLAFMTGGRRPVQGRARRAARAAIAVRALAIGAIGLALGYNQGLANILPYYGLCFLLAVPLIALRPRALTAIAGALVVVAPLVLLAADHWDWASPLDDDNPTFHTLLSDPLGVLQYLLVTGAYPAVVYMAYICVGVAIGRLDLSATRVAVRLAVGGLALAVAAWVTSSVLVFHLGGLQSLLAASDAGTTPTEVVWDDAPQETWWWLATRAHHSGTPLDMLQTLGSAMAVLGVVLLLAKVAPVRRLLWPVGVAGAMTLTVYSAHVVVLATEVLDDYEIVLWLTLVTGALVFAVLWKRRFGQGPVERLVAVPADWARTAVLAGRFPPRRPAQVRPAAGPIPRPRSAGDSGAAEGTATADDRRGAQMDQREQGTRRTDAEESGRTAPERSGEHTRAETGVQLGRGKGDAFEPEESAPAETPETD